MWSLLTRELFKIFKTRMFWIIYLLLIIWAVFSTSIAALFLNLPSLALNMIISNYSVTLITLFVIGVLAILLYIALKENLKNSLNG